VEFMLYGHHGSDKAGELGQQQYHGHQYRSGLRAYLTIGRRCCVRAAPA